MHCFFIFKSMKFNKLLYLFLVIFFFQFQTSHSQNQNLDSLLDAAYEIRRSNYPKSDSLVNWIINFSREVGDAEMQLKAIKDAAMIKHDNGFFAQAESYFKKGIRLADSTGNQLIKSKLYIDWAWNLLDQNKQTECLDKGLKALEIAREINDTVQIIKVLSRMADLSRMTQSKDLAMKYNRESIDLGWAYGDSNLLVRCYNNLSTILGELGRDLESIDTLKKALKFTERDNRFGRAKLNSNIAFSYRNLGYYDSALIYNRRSLKEKKIIHDVPGIGYSLDAIGRCYLGLQKFDSSEFYLQQALDTAVKYNNAYRQKDILIHLSELYEEQGLYDKAYLSYKNGKLIDDSLYTVQVAENVRQLERKFDISKKEREIERLDSERKLSKSQNQILLVLIVGLVISLLLIVIIFLYHSQNKERKKQLAEERLKLVELEIQNNRKALNLFVEDLQQKNRQLKLLSDQISEKEALIDQLQEKDQKKINELNDYKILTQEDWERFKKLFSKVNPDFFKRLKAHKMDFTNGDQRLMALMKLELSNLEIADALGISSESVSKAKSRLKKKLSLEKEEKLSDFVHRI